MNFSRLLLFIAAAVAPFAAAQTPGTTCTDEFTIECSGKNVVSRDIPSLFSSRIESWHDRLD